MQQNARTDCPKCSRPLQKFNGHIGYCPQHKWVSPFGLGFDAEAAAQNLQDQSMAEKQRLDQEREQYEAEQAILRKKHRKALKKAIIIVGILLLIIALIVFFMILPGIKYKNSVRSLTSGNFSEARNGFTSLKNYKDSSSLLLLSDAMLDMQKNQIDKAENDLRQLLSNSSGNLSAQITETLRSVIEHRKDNSLNPKILLLLVNHADIIDPDKTLDVSALKVEGHIALLGKTVKSTYLKDIDANGEDDLIVLNPDHTVSAYRMTADSNVPIKADSSAVASCAMTFAGLFAETDPDASVACYAEAYRLLPNDETRLALSNAYRSRSIAYENAGDMVNAIADARSALEISNSTEDFSYYYEVSLRNCKNENDTAAAIRMWNDFAETDKSEIIRYSANSLWQKDAAQLHIAYAAELAAAGRVECLDELRAAASLGADVKDALSHASTYFQPGITLAHLRLYAIELRHDNAEEANEIRLLMAGEVCSAVSEWKNYGIPASDVIELIAFADAQNINLTAVDRESIYEDAAVSASGSFKQNSFIDLNHDGYKELLALTSDGKLVLYGLADGWQTLSTVDTRLPDSSCTVISGTDPLILVLSQMSDEFAVYALQPTEITVLFRESGISRYSANGDTVTFSRSLAGSVERYSDYTYKAASVESLPVRTGVDWHKNDYPMPESAEAAVQRYFEALAYGIQEEASLLTKNSSSAEWFYAEKAAELPLPLVPVSLNTAAYLTEDSRVLFEVAYTAASGTVRTWVAAEYQDGWKFAGAADTYAKNADPAAIDSSIKLLSLNCSVGNTLSGKGSRHTYRILIPEAGRMKLEWQSGSKAVAHTSHIVSMHRDTLTGGTVFAYSLQPSPNKQQSKDQFVSAGVYYLTVEAQTVDSAPYNLEIVYTAEANIELESNDTVSDATPISLNTSYSGSLSDAKDVDFYVFTLEENSAVNVTVKTPGSAGKSTVYNYAVYNASNGIKLSTVSVPGNVLLAETGNLYLSSGTYLVQAAKGTAFTNDEYILTVNVSRNGFMESEDNNTPETADAVPVNEDVHASIGQEGDIDCYTFTLDGDAVVQPRFTFKPTDSSSKTYVLTMMDSSRRELLKVYIGGKESTKVIAPVALTAGTYTVKIENPRFVRQDYTLHLVSMAVDAAEKEPNDSLGLATNLLTGSARTGVLTTETDVDYYKLTFAEQTTVTLKFSFAQSTSKNTAFVLTVEQNGKTQWTANIKGDSGGMDQQLQFPAGEYYIKVKPSTWLSAVYTIAVD